MIILDIYLIVVGEINVHLVPRWKIIHTDINMAAHELMSLKKWISIIALLVIYPIQLKITTVNCTTPTPPDPLYLHLIR